VRSITGVDVMPISGVTCPQLRSSLGVSPAASIELRQRVVAEVAFTLSASNANTVSCSVTTYKTFFVPTPGIGTLER
jgi:hypothetical protein